MIRQLIAFWEKQGCISWQGYDIEVGAGTSNPATFLRCIGPEPFSAAYIEPCRRPTDGRYGKNPNRLQHFFQYQVILKPSPPDIQDLYLASLEAIGFSLSDHDIRFVQDDWEQPTIGASGLGWEVWMDGMEITQFTYFQTLAGQTLHPIPGEITYGIERLAMYLQGVDSIYDIAWNDTLRYGDIYHQNEVEWSHYNFEKADVAMWLRHFNDAEKEANRLIEANLPIPAYDFVMKASHAFNILDARGAISVTERTGYIARTRDLAKQIAKAYLESREKMGFPLLRHLPPPVPASTPSSTPSEENETTSLEGEEDFLLEIGSEELPSSYVPKGMESLEKQFRMFLAENRLAYKTITVYGTPRRLAIVIRGLQTSTHSEKIAKRGPPIHQAFDHEGGARPAAIGFFRSFDLSTPDLSTLREGTIEGGKIILHKGEEYLFMEKTLPAISTKDLLIEAIPSIIQRLSFPKKMRWGSSSLMYARPLRWLVALFGENVLPIAMEYLFSGRISEGHRQRNPAPFSIQHATDYVATAKTHDVLVDPEERKTLIRQRLAAIEKERHAHVLAKEEVLTAVAYLVEYPELLIGEFADSFVKIPKEVLISEMVEHQKYFPLAHPDGRLQSAFVVVADTKGSEAICKGNKKVLTARLSDGAFLYEQDLQYPLETINEKLKHVTFQKELGSLYDKVERLIAHASLIQDHLGISTKEKVSRAALLAKADLATGMVYEFPTLQGTMGRYYALAGGEDPEVAQALEEQWLPKGEGSALPETETGIILSLADKIDNLLSCFRIGLQPTSSADPYALRRQALGMIRMLLANRYHLDLPSLLSDCLDHFKTPMKKEKEEILSSLLVFLLQRAKTIFQEYQIEKDEVEASLASGLSDVCDALARAQALHVFRHQTSEFPLLYEVYKRAKGQIAQGKPAPACTLSLCSTEPEKDLYNRLLSMEPHLENAIEQRDYSAAYSHLASLQPLLSRLFDEVKILDEDPAIQGNRLALLEKVFSLFGRLLHFDKIQEKPSIHRAS